MDWVMYGFHATKAAASTLLPTAYRRLRDKMRVGAFENYRPELHYMRGPGPKWRAKYRGNFRRPGRAA